MYAKVGRLSAATGINALVSDADGHLVVTAAGARYADLVDSGRVFGVANQAAVDTTAALATGWTGLCVCNPSTSPVDLVMLEFGVSQDAAGAAGGVGIMLANTTGIAAALTIRNQKIGSKLGTNAIADDGATCGTPILYRVFGSVGSVATTGYGLIPGALIDLKGELVLQPGTTVLTYTTAATTGALCFHFLWAEIDR
jgi:hypothetical protein